MNRLPSFFVVGAPKAGTTSICETLANHPSVNFSQVKEPNFFLEFDKSLSEIPPQKMSEYEKLFDVNAPEKIRGEGSVRYLASENAVYWIKQYVPSAKIIIILRNPIDRIVSLYEMYNRLYDVNISKEEMIKEDHHLVKQCLMYDCIMSYIDSFSQDQVFIMIYDDFVKNPSNELNKLYKFLEIDEVNSISTNYRNKGGMPKSKFFNVFKNRQLIQTVKKFLPLSWHTPIDNFIKSIFFKKMSLTTEQKKKLANVFNSDVIKLSKLLDRDLCQIWFNKANLKSR